VSQSPPARPAHRPLSAAVTDELRRLIVQGGLRPGDRLREDELATALEVSRFPVREAIHSLASEGLVELLPRRGARVAVFSPERCRNLLELREVLEGLVARLATERCRPDQAAELVAVAEAGTAALAAGRLADLPALHTTFHDLLSEAAGNDLLSGEIRRSAVLLEWVYAGRLLDRMAESWREHADLAAAVADGDPARSEELARAHVVRARLVLADHGQNPVEAPPSTRTVAPVT
jgi:DNA-binding GntR family transcriptional regulator